MGKRPPDWMSGAAQHLIAIAAAWFFADMYIAWQGVEGAARFALFIVVMGLYRQEVMRDGRP